MVKYLVDNIECTETIETIIFELLNKLDDFSNSVTSFSSHNEQKGLKIICSIMGTIALKSDVLLEETVEHLLSISLKDESPMDCRLLCLSYILDCSFMNPRILDYEISMKNDDSQEEISIIEILESLLETGEDQFQILISYSFARTLLSKRDLEKKDDIMMVLTMKYLSLPSNEANPSQDLLAKIILNLLSKLNASRETKILVSNTVIRIIVNYFEEQRKRIMQIQYENIQYDLLSDTMSLNSGIGTFDNEEDKKDLVDMKRAIKFLSSYIDDDMRSLVIEDRKSVV